MLRVNYILAIQPYWYPYAKNKNLMSGPICEHCVIFLMHIKIHSNHISEKYMDAI